MRGPASKRVMTDLHGSSLNRILTAAVGCLTMLVLILVVGLAHTLAVQSAAVPEAKGTGLITGRVVDADSGKPVGGAIVILTVASALSGQRQGTSSPAAPALNQGGAQRPPTRILADSDGQWCVPRHSGRPVPVSYPSAGLLRRRGTTRFSLADRRRALELSDGQRIGDVKPKVWKDATITGRVVDEKLAEPVVGVLVRVLRRSVVNGQTTLQRSTAGRDTDDRGVYRASGLQPGDYVVEVPTTSTTMSMAALGAVDQPPQSPQSDGPGGNVIGGFVNGLLSGGRSGQQVGNFLLVKGGLQGIGAGTVAPTPTEDGRVAAYPTIFYPTATLPTRATVITLHSGEEKSGVDIQLALVPAFRISGTLTDLDGSPASNLAVRVVALDEQNKVDVVPDYVAMTVSGPRGEFTILAVPTGQYMVNVLRVAAAGGARGRGAPASVGTAAPAWAKAPVSIAGQDVVGLSLPLRGALNVTGHVAFDGTSPQPTGAQLTRGIRLQPIGLGGPGSESGSGATSPVAQINPDGSFILNGAMPGAYMIAAPGWPALKWIAKSISIEGHDQSDAPFDLNASDLSDVIVTFTDRPCTLAGIVRRATGEPDTTALVVGFPVDPQAFDASGIHTFSTRTTSTGTYSIPSMAPGDYSVVAIPNALAQSWQNADVLSRLAVSAVRVHVDDGAHATRDLTTSIIR